MTFLTTIFDILSTTWYDMHRESKYDTPVKSNMKLNELNWIRSELFKIMFLKRWWEVVILIQTERSYWCFYDGLRRGMGLNRSPSTLIFYNINGNHYQRLRTVYPWFRQHKLHPSPSGRDCRALKMPVTVEGGVWPHPWHLKAEDVDFLKLPQG